MIAKLIRIIADFFIRQKVVPEEQREIYEYGFELSISSVIGILIVLAIGLVSGRFWESVVFYIVFCFTRLFTGGYHAPNHLLCKITFAGALLAVLAADWLLKGIESYRNATVTLDDVRIVFTDGAGAYLYGTLVSASAD